MVYESLYHWSMNLVGGSETWTFVLLSVIVLFSTTWSLCGALAAVDHWNLMPHRKIEQPPSWPKPELYRKAVVESAKGLITLPMILWLAYKWLVAAGAIEMRPGHAEPFWQFPPKMAFIFLFLDLLFYWSHRLCHVPWVYVRVHKQHHEFHESVGFAHSYAGLVEGFFVNGAPMIAALVALRYVTGSPMHFSYILAYFAIRLWETIDAHSGYYLPFSPWNKFPFSGGAEKHNFHHSHNTGCFGILGIWDPLMGTDASYKAWKAKQKRS